MGRCPTCLGASRRYYFGLGLFTLASVGCAFGTDIDTLVALRFVQGLGAAAGMAIPRAVVRDLHTGTEAARLDVAADAGVQRLAHPGAVGGQRADCRTGWRGVFWAVALAATAGLALVFTTLSETRPASERVQSSLASALRAYGLLLRDRHYLGLVFIGGCAMSGFVYLASSPFVLINHYGLTPPVQPGVFGQCRGIYRRVAADGGVG